MVAGFEILPVLCMLSPALSSKNKKKEYLLQKVNLLVLEQLNPQQVKVKICLAEVWSEDDRAESKLDEMWNYVTKKENQRWLWHAIDHHSGKILFYVFRTHKVFLQLKALFRTLWH